jgi:acyl carrier protein
MTDNEKIIFIANAITEIFNKNIKEISPDSKLLDLGLDSLDIVELQIYYEEQSGIEIDSDEVIVTVKDLMKLMK